MEAKFLEMIFAELINTQGFTVVKDWYNSDLRLANLNFFEMAKEFEYYLNFLRAPEIEILVKDKFITSNKSLSPNGFKTLTYLRNFHQSLIMN